MTLQIINGDSLEVLATLPDCSIDAVVTDPPYGLSNTDPAHVAETIGRWLAGERDYLPSGKGFMGKEWDGFVPPPALWDECLRVLKPGGHVLAFAGSRTMDLMSLGLRLAGFDIRDSVAWLYGSGFPKSMDLSKAIDKAGGNPVAFRRFAQAYSAAVDASGLSHTDVDRHLGIKSSSCYWAREDHRGGMPPRHHWESVRELLSLDEGLAVLYDEAEREVVGTKKSGIAAAFGDGQWASGPADTVDITAPATDAAKQWEGWGTALKPAFEPVIMARKPFKGTVAANVLEHGTGALNIDGCRIESGADYHELKVTQGGDHFSIGSEAKTRGTTFTPSSGRFPANVILDEDQAAALDEQSGIAPAKAARSGRRGGSPVHGQAGMGSPEGVGFWPADAGGGASRFFYCAKAPKSERPVVDGVAHPTVKPLSLMRYLIRMVTPPGGVVLEPFAGSGTTVEAALMDGFGIIAIERDETYLPLIQARIDRYLATQMEDLI